MFSVRRLEAEEFLAVVVPFLAAREVENNLMIGLAQRIVAHPETAPAAVLCAVEDRGKLVGASLRTPPNFPIVTALPPGAAAQVAEFFASVGDVPDGALGPGMHGRDLAERFAEKRHGRLVLASDEIVYELTTLCEPRLPPGRARAATPGELPLVTRFLAEFFREVALPHPPDPVVLARRIMDRHAALVWDDEGPVSLACWARHTLNGTAIAPVYTPPAARNRGYASAVTAALCRELLASGRRFVCLHAERGNAASNHVYQSLGFRAVATINVWSVR
ncbi:MAG TPA: GNAT family N-acetyltransferase [Polyangiaceae bacterium]|nr:GNAT family N-acetyltransferase [Polyangiaceae bacterium]